MLLSIWKKILEVKNEPLILIWNWTEIICVFSFALLEILFSCCQKELLVAIDRHSFLSPCLFSLLWFAIAHFMASEFSEGWDFPLLHPGFSITSQVQTWLLNCKQFKWNDLCVMKCFNKKGNWKVFLCRWEVHVAFTCKNY